MIDELIAFPGHRGTNMRPTLLVSLTSALWIFSGTVSLGAEDASAATRKHFRTKVLPLLEARCFECHGPKVSEPKGGLRFDSREALLKGGESGGSVVAGKPDESLLVEAIRYEGLEMPPRTRLPQGEVDILVKWVKDGAAWPVKLEAVANATETAFPLIERRDSHWSWRPVRDPSTPTVRDETWPQDPLDNFVLSRLEEAGLSPAADADRRTLIRRVWFDLIGLPPSSADVDSFVNDPAPTRKALARVVDRLLESKHFGEHWARHWLDLVRYAETLGHEFDYPLRHAFEYRDYVIRAFNADVPYDDFVREHIAGDLLLEPRRSPEHGFNESVIGTGFWFLGEDKHAPVDARDEEAARVDNQLDVFSKTFLGLTVACARCHDHKFDAISQADYYALFGFLKSSRRDVGMLDEHGRIEAAARQLQFISGEANTLLSGRFAEFDGQEFAKYVKAARRTIEARKAALSAAEPDAAGTASDTAAEELRADATLQSIATVALDKNLDPTVLANWISLLDDEDTRQDDHPLSPLAKLIEIPDKQFGRLAQKMIPTGDQSELPQLYESFDAADFGDWFVSGPAFGSAPTSAAEWDYANDDSNALLSGVAHSGRLGRKFEGVLRSPTFTIEHPQILYRVAGENSMIRLIIDGYQMDEFNALLFRGAKIDIKSKPKFEWVRQAADVANYIGHRAHIELIDRGNGWLAVDEIRFANPNDRVPGNPIPPRLLQPTAPADFATLANRYGELWGEALSDETSSASQLLEVVADSGLSPSHFNESRINALADRARKVASTIPSARHVISICDGTPEDEYVFIRGTHKNRGPETPRRFLEALHDENQVQPEIGSGRLQLAEQVLSSPYAARVMANRIWHHLFGRGIVASVDNFGVLGQEPTHPLLLDALATRFVDNGWSVKRLIRDIVLSRTYRMSSATTAASESDPANLLMHRHRVRRLTGEQIRDATLAISGRLDRQQFGSSVPVYLTSFMQGRGRPRKNGPLDGAGRRSIYSAVNRNFLSPLMLAFDTPIPFTTIGRRSSSNVPAQALILMNDPFFTEQSEHWANRMVKGGSSVSGRIADSYRSAFARNPTSRETDFARVFLKQTAREHGINDVEKWRNDAGVWSAYCHVLMNTKEYVFLR